MGAAGQRKLMMASCRLFRAMSKLGQWALVGMLFTFGSQSVALLAVSREMSDTAPFVQGYYAQIF